MLRGRSLDCQTLFEQLLIHLFCVKVVIFEGHPVLIDFLVAQSTLNLHTCMSGFRTLTFRGLAKVPCCNYNGLMVVVRIPGMPTSPKYLIKLFHLLLKLSKCLLALRFIL